MHGPIGSMVKTSKGLRERIPRVFTAYVVCVISFAISTATLFWILMYLEAAIVSTAIFVVATYGWWKYVCSTTFSHCIASIALKYN